MRIQNLLYVDDYDTQNCFKKEKGVASLLFGNSSEPDIKYFLKLAKLTKQEITSTKEEKQARSFIFKCTSSSWVR